MNITTVLNKTVIVWQDVFKYHKQVSFPVQVLWSHLWINIQWKNNKCICTMSYMCICICSRVGLNMWWRCGKKNVTCVRCARWLRPGWRSSWQHHSIWTCLDPRTTGLATTPCARSPLRVRSHMHSVLSVVVSCLMDCSTVVFSIYLYCVVSLSMSFPCFLAWLRSKKKIPNCCQVKKSLGIMWCVVRSYMSSEG